METTIEILLENGWRIESITWPGGKVDVMKSHSVSARVPIYGGGMIPILDPDEGAVLSIEGAVLSIDVFVDSLVCQSR